MIRIDLGKDDFDKKPKGLGRFKLPFRLPGLGSLERFTGDIRGFLLFGIAVAIAFIPHLFIDQYRAYIVEQHRLKMRKLEENIEVLKQEALKLGAFQRELESYTKQKAEVSKRLEAVKSLLSNRTAPVNVLDALGQNLPQRAWLTGVDFKAAGGSGVVKISGQALSNEDISDYLDKLAESVHLTEVRLEEVGTGKLKETEVRTFSITTSPKLRAPAVAPVVQPPPNQAPGVAPAGAPAEAPPPSQQQPGVGAGEGN